MSKKRTVEVKPIFSLLDPKLERLVSTEALEYAKNIEKALEKYSDTAKKKRIISLDKISLRVTNSPLRSCPLSRAAFFYAEKETVTTPFILGLALEQKFLQKINDIQSIEIFEEEQLFRGKFNRPSQLCLRRKESRWIVDISNYVHDNKVNHTERENPSTINVLSFVKKIEFGELFSDEDLQNKIIG